MAFRNASSLSSCRPIDARLEFPPSPQGVGFAGGCQSDRDNEIVTTVPMDALETELVDWHHLRHWLAVVRAGKRAESGTRASRDLVDQIIGNQRNLLRGFNPIHNGRLPSTVSSGQRTPIPGG